jgi:IMP dehydrogenase/GMP reductase
VIRPAHERKTVGTDKMEYIRVKTEQALKQTQKLTLQTIPHIKSSTKKESQDHFRFFGPNNCRDSEQPLILV